MRGSNDIAASSVTFQGSSLWLVFDRIRGAYEGTVKNDKTSIKGTWTQASALPLELGRATEDSSWRRDRTPHTIQFVTVENNVKLEVVDWGGSGPPLALLAGQTNNAHGFDKFAPKLIGAYHVGADATRAGGILLGVEALIVRDGRHALRGKNGFSRRRGSHRQ